MRNGRFRLLAWDETQTLNEVTVPFGHIWQIHHMFGNFVASSEVANRDWSIIIDQAGGAADMEMTRVALTASQTRTMYWGAADDSNQITGSQRMPSGGHWLIQTDKITIQVTNEQGGDDWDMWAILTDYVIPRP